MSVKVIKAPEATLEINGEDFGFYLHQSAYVEYVNEFQGDDKVAPGYNFAAACVKPDQKEKLCELMQENAAITMATSTKLLNEFGSTAKVSVKK
jgi:hypothetical protein